MIETSSKLKKTFTDKILSLLNLKFLSTCNPKVSTQHTTLIISAGKGIE